MPGGGGSGPCGAWPRHPNGSRSAGTDSRAATRTEQSDQYAAVASVMRRGQDWRAAGLMLIGRGHLVAREKAFRLLLRYLLTPDTGIGDPLEYADEQMTAAAGQPLFKRIARIARRNISAESPTTRSPAARSTRRPQPSR